MRKLLLISGIILLAAAVGITVHTYKKTDSYKIQKEIADNIIRFHVRANSDSDEDQQLKLEVKDEIVTYLQSELGKAKNLDEARNILYYDKEEIKKIADQVIADQGYEYNVNVYFEKAYFPLKTYGDMSFPPGEYEAFRVDIGEAEGHNWWCVLYPPLCFVDSAYSVVPDDTKEKFDNILSEEAYDTLTMKDLSNNTYEFRFKYLTFLNKLFD